MSMHNYVVGCLIVFVVIIIFSVGYDQGYSNAEFNSEDIVLEGLHCDVVQIVRISDYEIISGCVLENDRINN